MDDRRSNVEGAAPGDVPAPGSVPDASERTDREAELSAKSLQGREPGVPGEIEPGLGEADRGGEDAH